MANEHVHFRVIRKDTNVGIGLLTPKPKNGDRWRLVNCCCDAGSWARRGGAAWKVKKAYQAYLKREHPDFPEVEFVTVLGMH